MNRAHVSADIKLSRSQSHHKWVNDKGQPIASVDLGGLDIHFRDPAEARAIAAACIEAAEYIEQQQEQREAGE